MRNRLFARAESLVAATDLSPEYRFDLFVRFGVLAEDRSWLDRAQRVLAGLSAEENSGSSYSPISSSP